MRKPVPQLLRSTVAVGPLGLASVPAKLLLDQRDLRCRDRQRFTAGIYPADAAPGYCFIGEIGGFTIHLR